MNASRFSSLVALLLGGVSSASLFAQSTAKPGTIANLTLNWTITESVGGFLVKDADLEKGFGKNPSISYGADLVLNPLGFDAEQAKSNYYTTKNTVRYRVFDKEMSEFVDPTAETVDYSTKQMVTRYGNAQFLTDLVNAGVLPVASSTATLAQKIAGWSLVSVRVAMDEDYDSGDDTSYIFAIKTGQTPVLVGKIGDWLETDESVASFRLRIYPGTNAETYTASGTENTKYTRTSDGEGGFYFEPNEPTYTYKETYSGSSSVSVQLSRPSDVSIYASGLAKYTGSYNAKSGMTLTGAISGSLSGTFYQGGGSEEDPVGYGKSGIISGTFGLSAERAVADVSQYAALMPQGGSVLE